MTAETDILVKLGFQKWVAQVVMLPWDFNGKLWVRLGKGRAALISKARDRVNIFRDKV